MYVGYNINSYVSVFELVLFILDINHQDGNVQKLKLI